MKINKANIWDKSDGFCWYCGIILHPFRTFSIDHVHPISKGGDDAPENLVPVCSKCNRSKGSKSVEEYRQAIMKKMGISFSPEQLEYLSSRGVALPETSVYEFWFEKEGL